MLNVPFVKNPGGQCGQACMLMALGYYFPEKKFTFEQINDLIGRKEGMWTFLTQDAAAMDQIGLKVKVYSSTDIPAGRQAVIDSFKQALGKDFKSIMEHIDLDIYESFAKIAKKEGLFEVRNNSLGDLKIFFDQGCLVIPKVDRGALLNCQGAFRGHFVLIVDMDNEFVTIHDPSDGPAIRYPIGIFDQAHAVLAVDGDVLVVYVKKN